jgi:hypothetical protein
VWIRARPEAQRHNSLELLLALIRSVDTEVVPAIPLSLQLLQKPDANKGVAVSVGVIPKGSSKSFSVMLREVYADKIAAYSSSVGSISYRGGDSLNHTIAHQSSNTSQLILGMHTGRTALVANRCFLVLPPRC